MPGLLQKATKVMQIISKKGRKSVVETRQQRINIFAEQKLLKELVRDVGMIEPKPAAEVHPLLERSTTLTSGAPGYAALRKKR